MRYLGGCLCVLLVLATGCTVNSTEGPCEGLGDVRAPGQPLTAEQVKNILPHLSDGEIGDLLLKRRKGLHCILLGGSRLDRWQLGFSGIPDIYHYSTKGYWLVPFMASQTVGHRYTIQPGEDPVAEKVHKQVSLAYFFQKMKGTFFDDDLVMRGKALQLFPLFSFVEAEYVAGGERRLTNMALCSKREKTVSLLLGLLYKSQETEKKSVRSLLRGLLWASIKMGEREDWWGLGMGSVWTSYSDHEKDRQTHGPFWSMFGWGRDRGTYFIRVFWFPITIKTDRDYVGKQERVGKPTEGEQQQAPESEDVGATRNVRTADGEIAGLETDPLAPRIAARPGEDITSRVSLTVNNSKHRNAVAPALSEPTGKPLTDDFEDGNLDSGRWLTGSGRMPHPGYGLGKWSHFAGRLSEDEGHVRLRVHGPRSGITHGAEAWIMGRYDLNDGKRHIIAFTWQADVHDHHHNQYFIQVTDGRIPEGGIARDQTENTANFLMSEDGKDRGTVYRSDTPKQTWILSVDPTGSAQLAEADGTAIRKVSLDSRSNWFLRFIVFDATSSGFPAGDSRLNLYDVRHTIE